jgi:hypothetical protein
MLTYAVLFNSEITKYCPTEMPVAEETTTLVDPAVAPDEIATDLAMFGFAESPPSATTVPLLPLALRMVRLAPPPRKTQLAGTVKLLLIRKVPEPSKT